MKGSGSFCGSFFALIAVCLSLGSLNACAQTGNKWVGTWTTAEQTDSANLPPSPGLTNNTLRQIVCVSIGGDSVRVKLSNNYSSGAVTINNANIAVSTGKSAITASTITPLTFNGRASVTINLDSAVWSDPIAFSLTPRMKLAISIYFGQAPTYLAGHPGSRTTSYLVTGRHDTSAAFSTVDTVSHWFTINTIDVWAASSAASVAILGNSLTDGRGSITDSQDRWPDLLAIRLLNNQATNQVGVLNLGIGANCVLTTCTGPSGVSRYQGDVLNQHGIKWVIIFEGVNDIGGVSSASGATSTANSLIAAYKQFISEAHADSLKIYGATIMPFQGNSYYNQYSESCRETVNAWIRTGGYYDSILDFDKVMRNPKDTIQLGVPSFQNDSLHPTEPGYQTLANSIDLNLFLQNLTGTKESAGQQDFAVGGIRLNHVSGTGIITFDLPREARVSLKIYSILGKEIAELAGTQYAPGRHTVQLQDRNLARGLFLYSFTADNVCARGKIVY